MRRFSFFILTAGSLLFSCSTPNTPGPVGVMNATINGSAWESVTTSAVITNSTISIVGLNKDNESIELDILKGTQPATYNVKGGAVASLDAAISVNPGTGASYASTYYTAGTSVGSVVISEINAADQTMSGTFTGKVKRFDPSEQELTITTGSFTKIPYNIQTALAGNSFSAKIDGLRLSATTIAGTKDEAAKVVLLSFTNANKNITLSLLSSVGRGTYTVGGPGNDYYGTYTIDSKYYPSYAGSFSITTHNIITKRIEGTFNLFVQPDVPNGSSITISEGTFAVSYN